MTWLFSLYWLGALAVAGPILFHMWRRTPRGERSFSSLMFLAPSPPRVTSRSRVEHWLLMVLRASALALLAFAFTRPLWRTPVTELDDSANEQLLAILVDTSASMRRDKLWDQLIAELDERLAKLPPQTSVALYQFDHRFIPVAGFSELKSMEQFARRELVRTRLKTLKPTWKDTQLGEALVRTAMALQDAQTERAKTAPQRIWLASDLQSGAEIVALQGYEWPDDLPVELVSAQAGSTNNAGLQVVERNLESGDNVLRVRITNAADSAKEQFTLKWETNESPEIAVYVPPGQSRILIPPKLPAGVTSSSLILKGDDHDFDNRVYVAESAPETRLVFYCGSESSNDTDGARFYLERVYSASQRFKIEVKGWHNVTGTSIESRPSLIVLIQPELEIQSIVHTHLTNGGTVVIAAPTAEATLASLKLCGRDGIAVTEANIPKYAMLSDINFEHPVFAPFAESQFSDFTGIRFWKHRTINGLKFGESRREGDRTATNDDVDRVLARFDDGDPAIVELSSQRGRIIVFTAGWQPADSQFARSSKFPMLMFRLLENSSGATSRPEIETVGKDLVWPTRANLESTETGTAILPDGTELSSLPLDHPFTQTDVPGLYTLRIPGRTEQIAVNLSADESRTTPLTPEQLEGYGLKMKSRERPIEQQRHKDRQRQLQLAEIEQSQKLWQTVLFVVIGVLLLETLLSGFFGSKHSTASAR